MKSIQKPIKVIKQTQEPIRPIQEPIKSTQVPIKPLQEPIEEATKPIQKSVKMCQFCFLSSNYHIIIIESSRDHLLPSSLKNKRTLKVYKAT